VLSAVRSADIPVGLGRFERFVTEDWSCSEFRVYAAMRGAAPEPPEGGTPGLQPVANCLVDTIQWRITVGSALSPLNHSNAMKTQCSPYHRPCIWLIRRTTVIALLILAICLLFYGGFAGVAEMVTAFGLGCAIAILTLETIASILVAGFCQWTKTMGAGLGELVAAMRKRSWAMHSRQ
jgi:hypothetical protein